MARRKPYKKGLLSFSFNTATGDDFPVKLYILKYVTRLIGNVEPYDDFIELLISMMDVSSRGEMINTLLEKVTAPEYEMENEQKWRSKRRAELLGETHDESSLTRSMCMIMNDHEYGISRYEMIALLADIIKRIYEEETSITGNGYSRKVDQLGRIFELDDDEKELLCFLYCMYGINFQKFNTLADKFTYGNFIRFASIATGIPMGRVRLKIGKKGRMYKSGFFDDLDVKSNNFYSIHDTVLEYLCDAGASTLIDRYVKGDRKGHLELSSFGVAERDREIVLSLLSSGKACNILLYGTAGTGKTEFARSAVRSAGLEPKFVQFGDTDDIYESKDISKNRIIALRVGVNTVDPEKHVLIVDEADFLLNSRYMFYSVKDSPEKGWLNSFLESSRVKILWISNDTGHMEESTQRRFDFSMRFNEFTMAERQKVFHNLLKKYPLKKLIGKELVETLSEEYRINAGGIASALDSLAVVFSGKTPEREDVEKVLRGLLNKHEELILGREHGDHEKLAKIAEQYDPSILHTDTDTGRLEKTLGHFLERLDDTEKDEKIYMNLLFWGTPGTGKTEYAKYIAKSMKRKLLVKRYSDLESMFLGETEQNIAAAFREAEKTGSMLFIDEADSFFTCRSTAQRSWEVSRTNEFLTQLENHRGIFICCTNLLPNMDKAAMRRFNWKIEFRPLRPADRFTLFGKYFNPKGKPLSIELQNRVCGMDGLTPGDMRAVWNRNRYLAEDEIDTDAIAGELEREVWYRKDEKARVGF